ncbi:MAG: DEAD/DEAH box helicase [Myxococcota bacterium]|nr:DEAD/DEAH box helicase [Myxococcota bacterium]
MPQTFTELDGLTITETISAAMSAEGITAPTPVQQESIGAILAGKHVLMHSGTGTGKTLAYVLPLLQRLREQPGRAVIFAPGAELVMQTMRVIEAYRDPDLTVAAAIATTSHRRQKQRIVRSTRLIVGTPDRLLELFAAGKLKKVTIVVLDELEPILSSRGADYLAEVLSRPDPKRQFIVASATLGRRTQQFLDRFMADRVTAQPASGPLKSAIRHIVVPLPPSRGKEIALASFVENNRCRQAIVFAVDPRHHRHLYRYLSERGVSIDTVSRERTKAQRRRALDAFRDGKLRVLLTTDGAARGLDIPDVPWVIHYDLPRTPQEYIHRAGRTGRAGKEGSSVVLADRSMQSTLRRLERSLDLRFDVAKKT